MKALALTDREDELLKLFPDAGIRSFFVVSTFDPKHAKPSGMHKEVRRLYVHEGGGRVYTAFDGKDMLALARLASLRLDTRERRKWFARQVSGPVILSGDFNTWRQARFAVVSELANAIGLEPLIFEDDRRTRAFGHPLDYIFVRGLTPRRTEIREVSSSDHNPLSAELAM